MKICIYGAGAIGGLMAARLAIAGADVTCIARGAHLAAMQANGLRLRSGEDEARANVRCTDDPAEAGPQDYVVLTMKAHSAAAAADRLAPLLGPGTAVVTAENGVPWWYFHQAGGPYDGKRLRTVDPDERQWETIGPERVIGCVVYPAARVVEPGVVLHEHGDRFSLGEPDGTRSERALALSKTLVEAGFKAPVRPRIREEIWVKLWGNATFNPISAVTGGTLAQIIDDPGSKAVAHAVMAEVQTVAEALGIRFPIDIDRRIVGAREVGDHKTSMLQDLEQGRPMEIDALVSAVEELAELTATPVPNLQIVSRLVKLRGRVAGCYEG